MQNLCFSSSSVDILGPANKATDVHIVWQQQCVKLAKGKGPLGQQAGLREPGADRGYEAAELAGKLHASRTAAHDHKVQQARAFHAGAACHMHAMPLCAL